MTPSRRKRALEVLKRRLTRLGIPLETDHYEFVDVLPDSPEWLDERRNSIGSSEIAAVLDESIFPEGTPFRVFLGKQGAASTFDPVHSYTAHAAEPLIAGWVEQFHPQIGRILPGFMARSKPYPWLHATFDRLVRSPDERLRPLQLKTSLSFARKAWAEGVPADYLAQEDIECLILDDVDLAHLAVWHYGPTDYKLHSLPARKDRQEEIIERTRAFYENHMLTKSPPRPVMGDDLKLIYPGNKGTVKTATEDVLDKWGQMLIAKSDLDEIVKAPKQEVAEGRFAIEEFLGDATELIHPHLGKTIHTWRPRADGVRVHLTTKDGYECL